jgi:hypothetical protein
VVTAQEPSTGPLVVGAVLYAGGCPLLHVWKLHTVESLGMPIVEGSQWCVMEVLSPTACLVVVFQLLSMSGHARWC